MTDKQFNFWCSVIIANLSVILSSTIFIILIPFGTFRGWPDHAFIKTILSVSAVVWLTVFARFWRNPIL